MIHSLGELVNRDGLRVVCVEEAEALLQINKTFFDFIRYKSK